MIKQFLLNLLMTLVWVALTGQLNYANFIFGFTVGFFILWMLSRTSKTADNRYFYRVPKIIMFVLYFLYEVLRANLEVALEILSPKLKIEPGIIEYPLNVKSDFEINLLCNIVALTPGTMIVKISDDKKYIYIHGLYMKDKQQFIDRMKNGIEKKLLEILR